MPYRKERGHFDPQTDADLPDPHTATMHSHAYLSSLLLDQYLTHTFYALIVGTRTCLDAVYGVAAVGPFLIWVVLLPLLSAVPINALIEPEDRRRIRGQFRRFVVVSPAQGSSVAFILQWGSNVVAMW